MMVDQIDFLRSMGVQPVMASRRAKVWPPVHAPCVVNCQTTAAMRNLIRRFFEKIEPGASNSALDAEHDVRVATCALLLEMAHIDERFTNAEMENILSILQHRYGLDAEQIDVLVDEAEQERRQSVDYWKFARRINDNYSTAEKLEIIEMLWRIVYVDGKMDKYEHQLINTLSNLLRLTHQQLIDAKLKVTSEAT
ncbi:MAG TPA: TerB family tellurite resistance protein [Desulfobacterales bacterium]